MTKYRIKVIDMDVYEWTHRGEGDYICSKGGFSIDTVGSLRQAIKTISDYFDFPLTSEDINDDGLIQVAQIEDKNGYAYSYGDYITRYTIEIIAEKRVKSLLI
jgi:hypothetical protein